MNIDYIDNACEEALELIEAEVKAGEEAREAYFNFFNKYPEMAKSTIEIHVAKWLNI